MAADSGDDWREFRRRLIESEKQGTDAAAPVDDGGLWAHEAPLERGALLVAAPGAFDGDSAQPDLFQAVALLVEHSDEGSVALVLNRPTRDTVSSLGVEPAFDAEPLYWGGWAGANSLRFLHGN
eukprot:4740977-Prymnesium_polylepis.1